MEALQVANRVRCKRAAIKRALWCGEITFAEVGLDDPDLASMRVRDLLVMLPAPCSKPTMRKSRSPVPKRYAERQASRLVDALGTHPRVTFGALSPARQEQLRSLVAALPHPPTERTTR